MLWVMMLSDGNVSDLRRYLRQIYDVCEQCDASGVSVEFMGMHPSVRQLFELEVTAYLACLTAADGVISQEEIDFINDLMSRDYSLESCLSFASEHDMLADGFMSSVPVSFKLLVDFTSAQGRDISDVLISFYVALSAALVASDDEIAVQERDTSREYLHLLRGYKALVEDCEQ